MTPCLKVTFALLLLMPDYAVGGDRYNLTGPYNTGSLRLEIDNDIVWGQDSNFTSGWSLQYHTTCYDNWEKTPVPKFIKWIGEHFPTIDDEDSIVRLGLGFGQLMITPDDITNPDSPDGELPYAGTLTGSVTWQSFHRKSARIFQVSAGVLGEESLAGDFHTFLHQDLDWGENPEGWDTQRASEPLLNLGYQRLWNLAETGTYTNDWAGNIHGGFTCLLGNLTTAAEAGLGVRLGWNMQVGFNSFQAPPGVGIFQATQIPKPATASPHSLEFTATSRITGLLYTVLYDGSVLSGDDRKVERDDWVLSAALGFNYHYYDFLSVRLAVIRTSDILVEETLPTPRPGRNKTGADNSYGTLMIDFHF